MNKKLITTTVLTVLSVSLFTSCSQSEGFGSYVKYGDAPVFGDSTTGTIFDPYVLVSQDSLIMNASERMTGNIIRLASADGINWTKTHTMLECRPGTWEHIINRSCMLKTDTLWHMWYTGQSPDVARIGHATSKDGYTYEREDTVPVIAPTLECEGVSVMNPCVIFNPKKNCLQMWYAAGENYEPDVIFYAESVDGINWTKSEEPVLTKYPDHYWEQVKVGGCDVRLMDDGTYLMYYIGYEDVNTARICYATSNDGINWERTDDNMLIEPTSGAWDSDATYKPTFINWKGKDMLWYNGRTGSCEYIGLAIKEN